MPMKLKLHPLIHSLEASPHHFIVISDKHSRFKKGHHLHYLSVGEEVKENFKRDMGDGGYFIHFGKLSPPGEC